MTILDQAATGPVAIDPTVLQRRASDPAASVWVGASAGTGKTKVLTDRVLRLMLAGTPPHRILCITFTKAAAAEMANRINATLGDWAALPEADLAARLADLGGERPEPERVVKARRLFAEVVDCPGGMRILTIHAFAQSLLRRFPLEAELPPNFEVMDERNAAELLWEARRVVLVKAREEPDTPLGTAVARIAAAVSEDEFADLLAELARERGRLDQAFADGGLDGAIAELRRHLGLEPGETVESLLAAACADGAFDVAGLREACRALAGGSKTDTERAEGIGRWLEDAAARTLNWTAYLRNYLTAEGEVRKTLATKKVADGFPAAVAALEAEAARLIAVAAKLRSAQVAAYTESLLVLGDALTGRYRRLKEQRAQLDFDDLILKARDLLERPGVAPWVLFKLDGGIDHLLIDEAQDTNPDQWAVARLLAEEFFSGLGAREPLRTLFVVGDEKQSIFSFQRADPAEFLRMRRHFAERCEAAGTPLRVVDLAVSFRSVGAVLKCVDAVFAEPAARDGVLSDPDARIEHLPFRRLHGGEVELWPPVVPEDDPAEPEPWAPPVTPERGTSPQARLAHVVAARIANWIQEGNELPARGRLVRADDVMVLVRRRSAFVVELVRALKERRVAVAGVDRMVLTGQLPVQDLLALGQFLLLPEDDLTLAVVLKTPLVGLGEDELLDLAAGRRGTLWQALQARSHEPVFAPAHAWLKALMARADFAPPYELFAGILGGACPADPKGSGRRAMLRRLGPDAEDPLDEFLTACLAFETTNPPSLQGFLHWLQASEAEIKRELEQAGGAVRIMTVHGSKGLQAPVVVLPDTLAAPDQSPPILWPHGGDGRRVPLWAPRRAMEDAACRRARAQADQRRDQEYRRLLYVALTRAEDRLVVCGYQGRRAPAPSCWYRLVEGALSRIAEACAFDFGALSPLGWAGPGWRYHEAQATTPVDKRGHAATGIGDAGELPAWALAPAPDEPTPSRPLTPSRPSEPEPAVRSPLGREDEAWRFRRGLLIHRLLQTLPDLAPDRRAEAGARFLASPQHRLDPARQAALLAEVLAVLDDPRFARVFGPGSLAEVPVVGRIGDKVLSGQIDRVLVTDEAVWIVDFKTNRPPPSAVRDVAPVYLGQMAAYRAAVSTIWPGRPVRCALLWTDAPRLMELPDAVLDGIAVG